jgi:transcriptional regulator with XRE-family HTH domain
MGEGRVSKALREALASEFLSDIERKTGISKSLLSRFNHGLTDLSLSKVDTLAELLGLVLIPQPRKEKKKPKK